MKKLYLVALAMIGICACVNLSSCSKDDKDNESVVTIIGTWYEESVESTYDDDEEDLDYRYFIVEPENCYFCTTSSANSWEEKYKYIYDESAKTMTVWEWYSDGPNNGYDDEADAVWQIVKLTSNELWMKINIKGDLYDLIKCKRIK